MHNINNISDNQTREQSKWSIGLLHKSSWGGGGGLGQLSQYPSRFSIVPIFKMAEVRETIFFTLCFIFPLIFITNVHRDFSFGHTGTWTHARGHMDVDPFLKYMESSNFGNKNNYAYQVTIHLEEEKKNGYNIFNTKNIFSL